MKARTASEQTTFPERNAFKIYNANQWLSFALSLNTQTARQTTTIEMKTILVFRKV